MDSIAKFLLIFWSIYSTSFGELVGEFKRANHGVAGTIFIDNQSTIRIRGFKYDGSAPDAFFYVGLEGRPSGEDKDGIRLDYPISNANVPLDKFDGTERDVIIRLPSHIRVDQLAWLSVWCRQYGVNFGEFYFDKKLSEPVVNLDYSEYGNNGLEEEISYEQNAAEAQSAAEPEAEDGAALTSQPLKTVHILFVSVAIFLSKVFL